MAGVKISALPPASVPLTGSELVPIVQSGVTKHVAASDFGNSIYVAKTSDTGQALMPAGTTSERDTGSYGALRYNTSLQLWEYWAGIGWFALNPTPSAGDTAFTPYGSISATTVQGAIQELDDETVKKTAATGQAEMPAGNTSQRTADPAVGSLRFNTETAEWEYWNTPSWSPLVPAASAQISILTIACSDETTALTTGAAKVTFRMPKAMTLTAVRASLTTAQASGSIFTVDINEAGTSVLSTKITIDNTEKSSVTAATQPVISDSALADDAEITIDIDQIGTSGATGLKVYLIGTYA